MLFESLNYQCWLGDGLRSTQSHMELVDYQVLER